MITLLATINLPMIPEKPGFSGFKNIDLFPVSVQRVFFHGVSGAVVASVQCVCLSVTRDCDVLGRRFSFVFHACCLPRKMRCSFVNTTSVTSVHFLVRLWCSSPSTPVRAMMIVWRIRGKIIRCAMCCVGSRPSDHYFRSVCLSVCLFVCLCRVFLSRLRSDLDQARTHVTCPGLVVSHRI